MKRMLGAMLAGTFACAIAVSDVRAQATATPDYVHSPAWTGAQLGEMCSAKPDGGLGTAALNLCHGYARGSVAAYTQLQAASRRPLKLFCLPPADGTVSAATVLQEFAAWVKATPEHAKERAVDALFAFLGSKFPCAKK